MSLVLRKELYTYTIIGGIATLIDWSLFALASHVFHVYYQAALMFGFISAGIFHYLANKTYTFKCSTQKIATQLSMYVLVMGLSLLLNMLCMFILVSLIPINNIILRMTTTLLMLFPNYLLHKHMTFSKRIFSAS